MIAAQKELIRTQSDEELLFSWLRQLRPSRNLILSAPEKKFDAVLEDLRRDPELAELVGAYLKRLFHQRRFKVTLTEIGLIGRAGFVTELRRRISNKFLPQQPPTDTLDYLLTNSFFTIWDHRWFAEIGEARVAEFLRLCRLDLLGPRTSFAHRHFFYSIQVLSQHVASEGLNVELLRMVPSYENLESPFLSLQKEIDLFTASCLEAEKIPSETEAHFRQIRVFIGQCQTMLEKAVKNKEKYGITFNMTIRIQRLRQELERLEWLLNFYMQRDKETSLEDARFIIGVVNFHSSKNRIRTYLRQTTQLVAFQATQHTGATGEHYITTTRKEYNQMFRSAAGGGMIVGIMCLIKGYMSFVETSPFGHAFLYSMNYALGFILIYFLHFTIATKQPAMTAAALAQALVRQKDSDNHYDRFSALFARLFRSQFIAFCGNVFFSFPTAVIICFLWFFAFDSMPLNPAKADKLLKEVNFLKSPALFHAAIAGFHLFFAGLFSGYLINRSIYHRIAIRIEKHPFLSLFLKESTRKKIAGFYSRHLGGISSNFWLGVLLGSTSIVSSFFGLNWDIRHITFAAGNFGYALAIKEFHLPLNDILMGVLCIGLIGFFNFSVSFIFSLIVAMRSRGISALEVPAILKAVLTRFVYSPKEFFVPPADQLPIKKQETPD